MSSKLSQNSEKSGAALSVVGLSKSYQLYSRPNDRLKEILVNWSRSIIGLRPKRLHSRVHALKPLSFSLERGKTIAVIGLNGAGKSTLLQLITGTVEPSSGKVEVNGKLAALLELGAGFDASLTGRQNVMFGGLVLGMSRSEIDRKFDSIAEFADIGAFIDYPVNTYSTGMYVRLAFALAIHCEPEILIVDEALSVGDFMFQQKCNRFIKEQLGETTKLLVTHDLGAVTSLADSVIVLHKGELVFSGEPQAAIEKYQMIAREEQNSGSAFKSSDSLESSIKQETDASGIATESWAIINADKLSGRKRAIFSRFTYFVNGAEAMDVCRDGDLVQIRFEIDASQDNDEVIIGYQMQDRFGNVVFGNNSIGSGLGTTKLGMGRNLFEISFQWPLVAEGKYSLTLGLGIGEDSLVHLIECWAHNIAVLQSAPRESLHGVFNVRINSLLRL